MNQTSTHDVIHAYYGAWADRDRGRVRALLADDLDFRSAQDRFVRADEFLDACWVYSEGLADVTFLREIYAGGEAFVILEWASDDGGRFVAAEYARIDSGKVREILVVNSSATFGELLD